MSPPRGARPGRRAKRPGGAEAFNALPQEEKDSLFSAQVDSLVAQRPILRARWPDSLSRRHAPPRFGEDAAARRAFLDDPITGKSADSLVYDVRNKLVYI